MLLKRWEPYAELKRMDHHFDRMWRHQFRTDLCVAPVLVHI